MEMWEDEGSTARTVGTRNLSTGVVVHNRDGEFTGLCCEAENCYSITIFAPGLCEETLTTHWRSSGRCRCAT